MIKKKILLRLIAFAACLSLLVGTGGGTVWASENNLSDPSGHALDLINEVIDFLEDMDMTDMADNVRQWLTDKKIKIDPDLKKSGSTTAKGVILLNKMFTSPIPADEWEHYEHMIRLATTLFHEKIHAHQAPLGGAGSLSEGVEPGDWSASNDVMDECVGPDPLEVDAFYKQMRALLEWWLKINAEVIPGSMSPDDAEKAESLKDMKKTVIQAEFEHALNLLRERNYEKANKFGDLEYLMDLFEKILDTEGLSEEQIFQQTKELLDSLINKLFDENGYYDKCRKLYEAKKGGKKTSMTIPAEPGSNEEYALDLPDGNGYLSISGLPADLDVGGSEMLEITVTEFMVSPEADAGYMILSPVYEVSWNAYSPIPFEITIYAEGMMSPEMRLGAFALTKTKVESSWTDMVTETMSEGDFHMLSAASDINTMFAIIAPAMSYIDMPGIHWAYDSTARLRESGVLDGGVILYPTMEVPRELFVKYLVSALGLELIEEPVPFTDIDPSDPYFAYISTAYHNKLTTGVSPDKFGFGEIIPREQSITFLIRAIGLEEEALGMDHGTVMSYIEAFTDISSNCSEWAYPYLAQAVRILMAEGYPDGTMRGKNLLSHAEVIALIDRIMIHLLYNTNGI